MNNHSQSATRFSYANCEFDFSSSVFSNSFIVRDIVCTGNETSLENCSYSMGAGLNDCLPQHCLLLVC